ncbi:putative outer arm dynein light chain 1 [Blattamonas nauphoetae]|uniref:Outer arm dynein light chain 1 n=1 Tax=Blattamonas nauphoetae TaxID=2049346 RepID=A0ABQ9X092_9EUKA|nr:putative outer arm dynein light chain 1 [Blattamonas nauphoetae]
MDDPKANVQENLDRIRKKFGLDTSGPPRMTAFTIKQLCVKHNLYQTIYLNEKLYLHYQGFRKIENLDGMTELKALWLQGNCISKIENLEVCSQVRCLYLQNNVIEKIEGLETLAELDSLDLSYNQIHRIEGLQNCKKLRSLSLTKNHLSSLDAILGLRDCPSLSVLDLSQNDIPLEAAEQLVELLKSMTNLRVLRLEGNPVVRTTAFNYRKTIIASVPSLTYLDSRPVFENERRIVNAWALGGTISERLQREDIERRHIRSEQRRKEKRHLEVMRMLIEDGHSKQINRVWNKERELRELGILPEQDLSTSQHISAPLPPYEPRHNTANFVSTSSLPTYRARGRDSTLETLSSCEDDSSSWDETDTETRERRRRLDSLRFVGENVMDNEEVEVSDGVNNELSSNWSGDDEMGEEEGREASGEGRARRRRRREVWMERRAGEEVMENEWTLDKPNEMNEIHENGDSEEEQRESIQRRQEEEERVRREEEQRQKQEEEQKKTKRIISLFFSDDDEHSKEEGSEGAETPSEEARPSTVEEHEQLVQSEDTSACDTTLPFCPIDTKPTLSEERMCCSAFDEERRESDSAFFDETVVGRFLTAGPLLIHFELISGQS